MAGIPSHIQDQLNQLRELVERCTDPAEALKYADRLQSLTRKYQQKYGVGLPRGPLEQALELDSTTRVRDHLVYLNEVLIKATEDAGKGVERRVCISMPPRSGKSHLVSRWFVLYLLRLHPEWKIILLCHDRNLATQWAGEVRQVIEDHPELGIRIAPDGGARGMWRTREGGGVYANSTRGALTGMGGNCILIDDGVRGVVEAHSEPIMDTLWNWWLQDCRTRLEPPGLCLVVGTRWSLRDFIARLLSDQYEGDPDEWEVINLPAIAGEGDALGRSPGEPLLSPLYEEDENQALARWNKIHREIGTHAFSCLYQGRPIPEEGSIVLPEWIRYWTTNPEHVTQDGKTVLLNPEQDLSGATWVDSWDLIFGGSDNSDFVVGQRWAALGDNRYLIDQRRGRWGFTDTIHQMAAWSLRGGVGNKYGEHVSARLVEKKANGAAALDVLRGKVSGLVAVTPNTSKELRFKAVAPQFEAGLVYLPHPRMRGYEWVSDVVDELLQFPSAPHDDCVDSLSQGLNYLRSASQRGQVVRPRGQLPARATASGNTYAQAYQTMRVLGGRSLAQQSPARSSQELLGGKQSQR